MCCRFSSLAICKSKFVENERDQIRSAMDSSVWSPVWSSLSKYKQINRRLIIIPLNFVSLNQRDALSTSSCLAFCLQLIAAGNARHVCPARLGSARLNCCAAIPSNSKLLFELIADWLSEWLSELDLSSYSSSYSLSYSLSY